MVGFLESGILLLMRQEQQVEESLSTHEQGQAHKGGDVAHLNASSDWA